MRLLHSTRTFALVITGAVAIAACNQQATRPVSDRDQTVATKGVTYLAGQQRVDGGFEVAGFPGFETPDAIAAIAANANVNSLAVVPEPICAEGQSCPAPAENRTRAWSTETARSAVAAVKTAGGKTPLNAIDAFAQTPTLNAGQAAKVIVLVSEPLGYDSGAFDPAGDGTPVNLVRTVLNAYNANGTFGPAGSFNVTLYSALATKLSLGSVPKATGPAIIAGQRADGGWNYLGSATDATKSDTDTTALAIQALVASLPDNAAAWETKSPSVAQTAIAKGLGFLASQQQADGGFLGLTATTLDPNSTSTAILAIRSVGFNPAQPCWRNLANSTLKGTGFASPATWLASQQQADGRVKSPNDSFGVNTFATSQVVQALTLSWLPIAERPLIVCAPENLKP
ncbi:MAG: prenyltransferase/squalene oxidase repeat-containing protein [Acidimicrobiia bacterium]